MSSWPGQKNGRIPTSIMVDVGGRKFLHPAAATSWKRLVKACADATKGRVYIAAYQDAYRSYARQVMFWVRYRFQGGNVAARPGTSNHGWGLAVDVTYSNSRVKTWVANNAHRYGWRRDPTESWHWNYEGSLNVPTKPVQVVERRKRMTWLG